MGWLHFAVIATNANILDNSPNYVNTKRESLEKKL